MATAGTETSLPALLSSLTQSLCSSQDVTTKLVGLEPPQHGLSLLDVKNELLLSYLRHVVFLILLKIRGSRRRRDGQNPAATDGSELRDAVVKKLVELRLYLEKGVRPLEDKLRYQVEKVLRAVDDAERHESAAADAAANGKKGGDSRKTANGQAGSDEEDDSSATSDSEEDGEDGEDEGVPTAELSELQFRPNPAAFVRPADAQNRAGADKDRSSKDGIYRPPRVAPTSMPLPDRRSDKAADRRAGRTLKSATMDEFITDELSTAPLAQPSIGTNIQGRGRHVKTAAERKVEEERRAYEETNFVRLPKESKKERAAKAASGAGGTKNGRMHFGGEEWRDLGAGVDRINRLTARKSGAVAGSSTRALLDKSRKRSAADTADGPRGSGAGEGVVEMGERYQKRLKMHDMTRPSKGKKR